MTITHKSKYGTYELSITFAKYANGQTAIKLWDMTDGFPYATPSLCVEDDLLKDDEVAIKNYSENEGLLEALIEAEVIEHPHAYIQSGFVKIPICKLKIVNNF